MLEEAVMCVHVCGSGHANASHYLYELPHAFGLKLVQYLEELKSLKRTARMSRDLPPPLLSPD